MREIVRLREILGKPQRLVQAPEDLRHKQTEQITAIVERSTGSAPEAVPPNRRVKTPQISTQPHLALLQDNISIQELHLLHFQLFAAPNHRQLTSRVRPCMTGAAKKGPLARAAALLTDSERKCPKMGFGSFRRMALMSRRKNDVGAVSPDNRVLHSWISATIPIGVE